MNIFAHLRIWLTIMMLLIIALPALVSSERISMRVNEEVEAASEVFGEERTNRIVERANDAWRAVVSETGLQRQVATTSSHEGATTPLATSNRVKRSVQAATAGYLEALVAEIYAVFLRGAILLEWLTLLGVFLVAVCVDGHARRRIKISTGGLSSPVKFSWASHTMIASALSPLFYILIPVKVSALFMPWWALLMAVPLSMAIANAVRIR